VNTAVLRMTIKYVVYIALNDENSTLLSDSSKKKEGHRKENNYISNYFT
jgi:hypothetical protein